MSFHLYFIRFTLYLTIYDSSIKKDKTKKQANSIFLCKLGHFSAPFIYTTHTHA